MSGSTIRSPAEILSRFLATVADKHPDEGVVFALRVAETGLDALTRDPIPVPVVAVIGPTQTGKSTVVNVLAGKTCVEASPLAAYTQQASALAVNVETRAEDFVYGDLRIPPATVRADCPACVIWDTPDFDSNASHRYRQQVARICALADLVVVVVSKEKYADRSVWRILETIDPLGTPIVVCLNKCDSADAQVLVPVIHRGLAENQRISADVPVLTLPLVPDGDVDAMLERREVQSFRRAIFERFTVLARSERVAALQRFTLANWDEWLAPVRQELECIDEWRTLLAAETGSFMARYRSEYIDHARHHDVAQKAILGLLELLEIPALAGPLSRARRMLTWPIRKLGGAFGKPVQPDRDQELEVLETALAHTLLSLRSEILNRKHAWWRALGHELVAREADISEGFGNAVDRYRQAFQPRIDRLSEELYEQLRKSPVTLNALRAARVSADAGGVVLAIKTGTLGLYDALFAPAVISLTSYLTEGVIGQYLKSVIGQLKREQLEQVNTIVGETVERELRGIRPHGDALFGISGSELDEAEQQIEALPE